MFKRIEHGINTVLNDGFELIDYIDLSYEYGAEMISIRATNLERFLTCPYAYKYEPTPSPDKMAFLFGTALHKLVEMHVQGLQNQDAVDIILNRFGVKERKMLKALTECFIQHLEERNLTYVLSEYSYTHKFEDITDGEGKHPILEGTFDLLFKDEEGQYIIVDIKTASKHWDEEHINAVNQKRIYPALAKLESGIKVSKFEYWVMNKTLSPKLQEVVFEVPEDNVDTVTNFMQTLVTAEDNLDFPANYTNYSCFFCALRQQCRAMNNLNSLITTDEQTAKQLETDEEQNDAVGLPI